MALTTAARVRQRLGIVSDGASGINDPEIDDLIVEMTAALEGWCGVEQFESAAYDHTHSGGHAIIPLRANYADAVTSVKIINDDGTEQDYAAGLWRLDKQTATLIHSRGGTWWQGDGTSGYFPEGYRNIRVVGTAGFLTVPDDLTLAATELVKEALLDRISTLRIGNTNQSGTQSQRRAWADLIAEHEWKFARWRRTSP